MSKEFEVCLNAVRDVQEFCSMAIKSEADIKVYSGEYMVNGKSLLGLFSLDLSNNVTVRVRHNDAHVVDEFIDAVKTEIHTK